MGCVIIFDFIYTYRPRSEDPAHIYRYILCVRKGISIDYGICTLRYECREENPRITSYTVASNDTFVPHFISADINKYRYQLGTHNYGTVADIVKMNGTFGKREIIWDLCCGLILCMSWHRITTASPSCYSTTPAYRIRTPNRAASCLGHAAFR